MCVGGSQRAAAPLEPDVSCLEHSGDQDHNMKPWPEETSGLWNRWTFSYMNYILKMGNQQSHNLTHEDLFGVPTNLEASHLKARFLECFFGVGSDKKLRTALWHVASPTMIPAAFCELLTVLCQVALPLLVQELLNLLEKNPSQNIARDGMGIAISIFLVLVLNALGNHRHRHLAMKSGVAMRAAMVAVLYEHTLLLSPAGKVGLTSGEIANLIAIDTQKLFDVAQDFHLIWALPLSIALVTIFLVLILGPVTLIGIAVLIILVPVVERVTSRMLRIRQKRAVVTDRRVVVVNSMLQGMKVTKLGNLEDNYEKRIQGIRAEELKYLRQELAVWAMTLVLTVSSPILASSATFATYVLIGGSNVLTASKTFSVLMLFSALRFPINYAGQLAGKAVQALSAMQRIKAYLERETRKEHSKPNGSSHGGEAAIPLSVRNATFSLSRSDSDVSDSREKSSNFSVSGFDFAVERGEVLAVCGPVASGKTTLVNGIIGEAYATKGSIVEANGNVLLAPQSPFILNASLRENILFGRKYDKEIYDEVIQVCCLKPDIAQLGDGGDLTEIGERGVTLSGGQKQRISLARAAYAQPDVVILDDPLSALDAGVSRRVFDQLIKSSDAFFSNAAVILVTHASHFLNRVDKVVVVVDGCSEFCGTWQHLLSFRPITPQAQNAINYLRKSVQENKSEVDERISVQNDEKFAEKHISKNGLMTVEEREHGLSSVAVWLLWFRRAGGLFFLAVQVILMAIDRFAYVATEYWLARWTESADSSIDVLGVSFPPQSDGHSAQFAYLRVYSSLIVASILTTILRSEWAVTGGIRAARDVFSSMLSGILQSPTSYFETTPLGRILNRCTYDVDVVDIMLTQSMSMFMISCSWYVAGVVVMCSILYWVALAIVPVTGAYWLLMLYHRRSGADLQRLEAISRSPIQAMVNEGIDGMVAIRVFNQIENFVARFLQATNQNSAALLNFVSAQRWLGLRIELLGSLVVLTASLLVVVLNEVLNLEPGLVGLLIIWTSNFTITLDFMVDTFSSTEAAITAIERLDAMAHLPSEMPMNRTSSDLLSAEWPVSGELKFEDVSLRYRDGLPLALDRLSFSVPSGKRCGIVGRTGAGKSSIAVSLFRLVEIEHGRILLDGVDLANLGLADVRGRRNGMVIIPQDPFLTGTTVRECVDPFQKYSDIDVLDALQAVRLAKTTDSIEILNSVVEEGGSNFSAGERQLLNLARALLSKPKVLVLDEATASVDGETDAYIQEMLRTRFASSTLLTVAHRLHTIMDYDTIVVMDGGKAVEQGSPLALLNNNGVFAELAEATGTESAKILRSLAVESARSTGDQRS